MGNDPRVGRFGLHDNGYGPEPIARRASGSVDLPRELARALITTFGRDLATAGTEFRRVESGRVGRQSQTWMRTDAGWKVVSAPVSWLRPPA